MASQGITSKFNRLSSLPCSIKNSLKFEFLKFEFCQCCKYTLPNPLMVCNCKGYKCSRSSDPSQKCYSWDRRTGLGTLGIPTGSVWCWEQGLWSLAADWLPGWHHPVPKMWQHWQACPGHATAMCHAGWGWVSAFSTENILERQSVDAGKLYRCWMLHTTHLAAPIYIG